MTSTMSSSSGIPIKIKSYHNNLKAFNCRVAGDTAIDSPVKLDCMKMIPITEVNVFECSEVCLA